MVILARLMLALVSAILMLTTCQALWNLVDATSNVTSQYVARSQDLVELISTMAAVVAAFIVGYAAKPRS